MNKEISPELDDIIFSDNLIRDDEMDKIRFTKRGVVDFSEYLLNLDDLHKFYDQNDLKLSYRKNGTKISNEFMLGRAEYKMKKSILKSGVDLKLMIDTVLFYNLDVQT